MPHVQSNNQVTRRGDKTRSDIKRSSPQAIPRDDLRTAFAGDENKGPAGSKVRANGTHLKSRRLRRDSDKTPKR